MSLPPSSKTRQRFGPDPIPGILPAGGVNILGGLPFAGKSRILAWWTAAWTTGGKIFDIQVPKLNVGVISTDRSWEGDTDEWFRALGLEIPAYSLQDDPTFDLKRLRRREERPAVLEAAMGRVFEQMRAAAGYDPQLGHLVIADTLSTFIPNTFDYNDVFVSISGIRRLVRSRECTMFGTMHSAKQRMSGKERYCRLIDRIAGSVAISGTADTMCYIAIPEEIDASRPLFEWHPHHAPRQQFELTVGKSGLFSWDGTELPTTEQIETASCERLLTLFKLGEELKLGAIIERAVAAGMELNEKTFRRWVNQLLKDGRLLRVARGCYKKATPS